MMQSDIVWLWQKLESLFPMLGMMVFFTVIGGIILRARAPWLFKLLFGKKKNQDETSEEIDEENLEHIHHKRRRRSDVVIDKFIELAREQNKFQGQQVLLMQQLVEGQKDMSQQVKSLYEREFQR